MRRWADRAIPGLLQGLERWGRRVVRLTGAIPAPLARRPLPTPLGRLSLLWWGMMRVFDEWVHGEDVRRALGLPPDDSAGAVRPAARHLLAGIPVLTLARLGAGARGRVSVRYADLDLPALGVDLASRRFGVDLADGDARVTARAASLVMVAARRDPWRDAEARGTLVVEGERATAEAFLDALLLV